MSQLSPPASMGISIITYVCTSTLDSLTLFVLTSGWWECACVQYISCIYFSNKQRFLWGTTWPSSRAWPGTRKEPGCKPHLPFHFLLPDPLVARLQLKVFEVRHLSGQQLAADPLKNPSAKWNSLGCLSNSKKQGEGLTLFDSPHKVDDFQL